MSVFCIQSDELVEPLPEQHDSSTVYKAILNVNPYSPSTKNATQLLWQPIGRSVVYKEHSRSVHSWSFNSRRKQPPNEKCVKNNGTNNDDMTAMAKCVY